jgi:hypothetical protein
LETVIDRRLGFSRERQQHIVDLNKRAAEAHQRLSRLYEAIEEGIANLGDSALKERVEILKATRDQANASRRFSTHLQVLPWLLTGFANSLVVHAVDCEAGMGDIAATISRASRSVSKSTTPRSASAAAQKGC